MIRRNATLEITQLLEEFPAVGVLGPRQVGKKDYLAQELAAPCKPCLFFLTFVVF